MVEIVLEGFFWWNLLLFSNLIMKTFCISLPWNFFCKSIYQHLECYHRQPVVSDSVFVKLNQNNNKYCDGNHHNQHDCQCIIVSTCLWARAEVWQHKWSAWIIIFISMLIIKITAAIQRYKSSRYGRYICAILSDAACSIYFVLIEFDKYRMRNKSKE